MSEGFPATLRSPEGERDLYKYFNDACICITSTQCARSLRDTHFSGTFFSRCYCFPTPSNPRFSQRKGRERLKRPKSRDRWHLWCRWPGIPPSKENIASSLPYPRSILLVRVERLDSSPDAGAHRTQLSVQRCKDARFVKVCQFVSSLCFLFFLTKTISF